MPRSTKVTLAALVLLAAFAPAASAATLDLGSGGASPHVVVNSSGTGFLTWADLSSNQVLRYCRLQSGASSCDVSKSFTYPNGAIGGSGDGGNSPVLAGGNPLLVDQRFGGSTANGQRYVYTSTDGGATFTPTTAAPANQIGSDSDGMQARVIYAPGSSFDASIATPRLLGVADGSITAGADFQGTTDIGGSPYTAKFKPAGIGVSTASANTVLGGSTLFVAYSTLGGDVYVRHYNGTGGQNADSAWGAAHLLSATGIPGARVRLTAGSTNSSIFAAFPDSTGAIQLTHYLNGNGTNWSAPETITGPGVENQFGVFVDGSGAIHVAYVDGTGLHYRYARNSNNTDFSNPQTIAAGGFYSDPELATNAAGNGFLTWTSTTNDFVVPIAPGEGPGDPGGGGGGDGGGGPTKDGDTTPLGGGTDLVLTVPGACVPAGSSFKVSVDARKKKGGKKGKRKAKVVEADFYKGKVLQTKDKKKPFEATIPTDGVSGDLEISAKVTVKVKKKGHKAKKVKKTLKTTISIC